MTDKRQKREHMLLSIDTLTKTANYLLKCTYFSFFFLNMDMNSKIEIFINRYDNISLSTTDLSHRQELDDSNRYKNSITFIFIKNDFKMLCHEKIK